MSPNRGSIGALRAELHRRRFVGRARELAAVESSLATPGGGPQVFYLHGPAGTGKTTLLRELARRCDERGTPVLSLDAREATPTPAGLRDALREATGARSPSPASCDVILIDSYDRLIPLDAWFCRSFVSDLPEQTLLVVAAREPPSLAWRTEPGWGELSKAVSLRNLSPSESREFLAGRKIPSEQHGAILRFTHGHPLALTLVAEVVTARPGAPFDPVAAPQVVEELLRLFVESLPSPAHRRALEACTVARTTSEPLLAAMLDVGDAHDLFRWLAGLSFVHSVPRGLYLHDLAREVIGADLRWRSPEVHSTLVARAHRFGASRFYQSSVREQHRVLDDLSFLHRFNPMARLGFDWTGSDLYADQATEDELPALLEWVERWQGPDSARCARQWFERQPEGVVVVRDQSGEAVAFFNTVQLDAARPTERKRDPGIHAVWRYLKKYAPLRPGESAAVYRFWMARDSYQQPTPAWQVVAMQVTRHSLTTPQLAFACCPFVDGDDWAPFMDYLGIERLSGAEFEIDGRRFDLFARDWRKLSVVGWLDSLASRAAGQHGGARAQPEVVVLSREDFGDAVRAALRDLEHPRRLVSNPLLYARFVSEPAGPTSDTVQRIATLRSRIGEVVEALGSSPRAKDLGIILERTYLGEGDKQLAIAAELGLPFSTYRRHLQRAVAQLTEALWLQEIGGG